MKIMTFHFNRDDMQVIKAIGPVHFIDKIEYWAISMVIKDVDGKYRGGTIYSKFKEDLEDFNIGDKVVVEVTPVKGGKNTFKFIEKIEEEKSSKISNDIVDPF